MKGSDKIVAGGILLAFLASMFAVSKVRGLRNNNWLNIKYDPRWKWDGQVGIDSDGFVIFDQAWKGIRAAYRDMQTKRKRGIETIRKLVSVWAPKENNKTDAYIKTVSKLTGIEPDQTIRQAEYPAIIQAMGKVESKVTPPWELIDYAIKRAYQ